MGEKTGWMKANETFRKIITTICGIAVFAIFLIIIIQVFFRYVLKSSMGGAEELPTYVMAVACWLAVPVAAMEDNHINIDLIPNLFKGRARILWSMWGELVEVVTMTFFTKLAFDYYLHMMEGGTVTGGLGIPLWIFYLFIVIGAGLCVLFGLINFITNLRRVIKWQPHS